MASQADWLVDEALALPADARLDLVDRLLESLNPSVDEELDRLWAAEAERRVRQVDAGETRLIPGEEVFARIRAKYGR